MTPVVENLIQSDLADLSNLQPEGWPDILPHYDFYTKSKFCSPIKVKINEEVVGIGNAIMHEHTAWLAHIIVHTGHRNKGLGTLITKTLIDSLQKKHYKTILLIATKLGEPVYRKLGFEKETEYIGFKQEKNLFMSEEVIAFHPDHEKQILDLDYKVLGEKRNRLLIPHLSHSKLIIENNSLQGFYMPTLGEGLIIATSAEAGKRLLTVKHTTINKTVLPIDNKAGHEFLLQKGFIEVFVGTKMRLGKKINWHPENLFSRIGGNLG